MRRIIFFIIISLLVTEFTVSQQNVEINKKANISQELRNLKHSDPHRPIYHFLCPDGYGQPFDPNGAIYWNGKYHLGYIYQTDRNGKWEHVWGHVVTTDLLHWTIYPDMLNVKEGDIEKGIFSGGAFLSRDSVPHIIYHGQGSNSNLIAYSLDKDLQIWTKFPNNPVLQTPTEKDSMYGKYIAWDPEAWYDKESDTYYQISGGKPASFFKSKDMKTWQYIGDFINPAYQKNKAFEDVSCPDFFKIGNKNVLVFISHYLGAQYYIGTFSNEKYTVEKYGRMNWPGGTFFAPEQLVDSDGRNIIWGWIIERKPPHLKDFGWSGILSLPRVLSLSKDNDLLINPPKEIESIRINEQKEPNVILKPNTEKRLRSNGSSMEIKMEIKGGATAQFGLKVFCSPDNKEETVIKYDPITEELIVDFKKSSIHTPVEFLKYCIMYYPPNENKDGVVSEQRVPFRLKPNEKLMLDVFIDRSIIEIFINGRQCVTQVVYPELKESTGICLFSGNESVQIKNIQTWEMSATNPY